MVKENEVGMKTVYTRNYSGLILYLNRMGTGTGETFFLDIMAMVAVICINAVWNKQSYLNNGLFSEQNVGVEQFVTYF